MKFVPGRVARGLWWLCGPQGPLRVLFPAVEPYLQRRQRAVWDREWERESQRPVSQLSTIVPRELVEAVESGWIPPSSSVLDIGSGRGQISAWLAERGLRVLGVDLSVEATKLARKHFEHLGERLEFCTIDICTHPPEGARFDAIFDRGCFHVIPRELRPRYVANMATWARGGARFLLLRRGRLDSRLVEEHRALFDPYFELVRTEPAVEPHRRSAGPIPRREEPGVAFWMVRRPPDARS